MEKLLFSFNVSFCFLMLNVVFPRTGTSGLVSPVPPVLPFLPHFYFLMTKLNGVYGGIRL